MQASYAHSLDAFVTALEQNTPPVPSLADGLKAAAACPLGSYG